MKDFIKELLFILKFCCVLAVFFLVECSAILFPTRAHATTYTSTDLATARCDERCKIKDYEGGFYLDTNPGACICFDKISFDQPIVKLPSDTKGRMVYSTSTPILRLEW